MVAILPWKISRARGERYDTETATLICDISPNDFHYDDFRYESTHLYRGLGVLNAEKFLDLPGLPVAAPAKALGL
jgi:hypothetical protein